MIDGRRLIHCSRCGDTWFDSGWTASCPSCRIEALEAENERLLEAGNHLAAEVDFILRFRWVTRDLVDAKRDWKRAALQEPSHD